MIYDLRSCLSYQHVGAASASVVRVSLSIVLHFLPLVPFVVCLIKSSRQFSCSGSSNVVNRLSQQCDQHRARFQVATLSELARTDQYAHKSFYWNELRPP